MSKLPITVLIAAKNEAVNLPRCLSAVGELARVVVIDSHSSDDTPLVAESYGAELVQFDYRGGFPKKRQWALDTLDVDTPWVLLLDADEAPPRALIDEIRQAIKSADAPNGFLITKGFHFMGRRFRFGGFSHAAVLFFRRGRARFERLLEDPADGLDMEVHERLIVDGPVGRLRTPLVHEDFKGLAAYIDRHNSYSTWEAGVRRHYLVTGRWGDDAIVPRFWGNAQERRRFLKKIAMRLPGEPWLWFGYHYFLRGGFLEGRRGLIASQIRAQYIAHVRAKMFEMECQSRCASLAPAAEAVPKFSKVGVVSRGPAEIISHRKPS